MSQALRGLGVTMVNELSTGSKPFLPGAENPGDEDGITVVIRHVTDVY